MYATPAPGPMCFYVMDLNLKSVAFLGAGKTAPTLRTLAPLLKDLGSTPSTQKVVHNQLKPQFWDITHPVMSSVSTGHNYGEWRNVKTKVSKYREQNLLFLK